MQAVDFSQHSYNPAVQGPGAAIAAAQAGGLSDFSFSDLLSVVNPLQHIPVISTLYRALTGDTIKTPEKIAGDTLYGGLVGFVSSVADSAFEAATGKNVGDTILAFFTGDGASKADVAAATPPATVAPAQGLALTMPDATALMQSLSQSRTDGDTAERALGAYKNAAGLSAGLRLSD